MVFPVSVGTKICLPLRRRSAKCKVMGCPVIVTQSGISYERSQLIRWLQTAPYTEPKTNMRHSEPIAFSDNVALRQAIRD